MLITASVSGKGNGPKLMQRWLFCFRVWLIKQVCISTIRNQANIVFLIPHKNFNAELQLKDLKSSEGGTEEYCRLKVYNKYLRQQFDPVSH